MAFRGKAADFVANDLRRIGMENVEVIPTKGHPLLYADWLHAPGKPTVLCYAHYDVQPPDPLMNGRPLLSSPRNATTISMREAQSMIRASSGWK